MLIAFMKIVAFCLAKCKAGSGCNIITNRGIDDCSDNRDFDTDNALDYRISKAYKKCSVNSHSDSY